MRPSARRWMARLAVAGVGGGVLLQTAGCTLGSELVTLLARDVIFFLLDSAFVQWFT